MKKIIINNNNKNRKVNKNTENILSENLSFNEQQIVINRLYLNDETLKNKELYLSELNKKLLSYKHQDKKNNVYHENYFINYELLIKKMVASKLNCYYCNNKCLFLYNKCYDDLQWTLDRINNNKGHTDENTVICCLKCNLGRGNIDHKRFIESKKIKFIKKLD